MGVGAGLYMYVVVVYKSSRSLSHILMSSCTNGRAQKDLINIGNIRILSIISVRKVKELEVLVKFYE